MIVLKPVDSSMLQRMGYSDGNLYVTFREGDAKYVYYDVPEHIYEGLDRAESKGEFMRNNIIGRFRYHQLNDLPM